MGMPSITLYQMKGSPPCRAVRLTARHLGLKLNLEEVNIFKKDHLKEEFLRLNPQHTVPTIKDGELVLWDSHAIQIYLASTYGKNESLYPSDPKRRAKVNQLLFFNSSTLYQRFVDYAFPVYFAKASKFDPEKKAKLDEAFDFLETFLADYTFSACDALTVADHTLVASVSTIVACQLVDLTSYPMVRSWIKRCRDHMPGYEELNDKPATSFAQYVHRRKKR